MKDVVFALTSATSFRKRAAILNRTRHETVHGTPMTTVAEIVEREGTAYQTQMNDWALTVFADHRVSEDGIPLTTEAYEGPMEASGWRSQ